MADSKKYDGSQWEHSLRKLTTATEAVENPLYSDGTAITAYTIKGNRVQNGTPTSSNPVEVQGVGERTAQLLDFNTWANNVYVVRGTKVVSGNSITITSTAATCFTGWNTTEYPAAARIPVTEGETIHLTWDTDADDSSSVWIFPNASATGEVHTAASNKSLDYTVPSGVDYITFRLDVTTANKTITYSNIMFNSGSTAKPFEPYGYKIPISSGGVTTNIYLGSTQTVRAIKKYEITGNEDWVNVAGAITNPPYFRLPIGAKNSIIAEMIISSHYEQIFISSDNTNNGIDIANSSVANSAILKIRDTNTFTDVPTLKTYLQQQYSNGTPVTVWYVLTTPETAAVNEPLMKIGDYADTLSNATSIPTTEGTNSITVDTTVQPSEFTATWTGWHNANVKEKSRNLFDKDNNIVNYYLASTNGAYQATSGMSRSIKLKISQSSVYSITLTSYTKRIGFFENEPTDNDVPVAFYNNDTNEYSQSSFTITSPASANYMVIFCYNSSKEYTDGKTINEVMSSVMVNTGSTALPYEPYWK